MKKLILLFIICPLTILGNENKVPSKIKSVTVYLSGAQIYRKAQCHLKEGKKERTYLYRAFPKN
ncbi:DUF4140 domain-containing protein [Flagellimonas onchidii]|uniref:DUF4140 domain-containing protein n=1 Tax=Flagellimonas onchidii TaxID=2562684 RepID=UPI001F0E96CD|nr:DUF4140 domain-containing protein [Allomuricauda onchidii]